MIDRVQDRPVSLQADLLDISRAAAYYQSKPVSEADLRPMRRIDVLDLPFAICHLPFAEADMLRDLLPGEQITVGHKHVSTLLRSMAVSALYCKPSTCKKQPSNKIYPSLLTCLPIGQTHQA